MRRTSLAISLLAAGLCRAGLEEDYAQALRLLADPDPTAARHQLRQIVQADPLFRRAWVSLAELARKEQRWPELAAWLNTHPDACLGRLEMFRAQRVDAGAWDREARRCHARHPDSLAVFRTWIDGTAPAHLPALLAEWTAAVQTSAAPAALFAVGYAETAPERMRPWLERVDPRALSPADRNELDDALFFAYAPGAPERAAAMHRLLERARSSGDADWIYRAAGRLGYIARDERRYADALGLMEDARRGAALLRRPTHNYDAVLGECLFRLGRLRPAIDAWQRSYAGAVSAADIRAQTQALGWLADQHNELGQHTAALDFASRALDLARSHQLAEISADQHVNRAFAWVALGQGPPAIAALQEARLLLQPPSQNWHARILNDMANLWRQLGRPQQALAAAASSLEIANAGNLRHAEAHLLQAESRLALGQSPQPDLAAAADLAPEIPSYRARGYLAAGRHALAQRNHAGAAHAFEQARQLGGGFPHLLVQALTGLSDVHLSQGRFIEALAERQQALDAVENMRTSLAAEHRAGFLASRIGLYRDSAQILLRLHRTEEAFLMAERARARALLDLREQAPNPAAPAPEALRAAHAAVMRALTPAERRQAELQLQAATDRYLSSLGGAGRASAPVTLERIQASLPVTTALLHYTVEEAQSTLFVVRRSRVGHLSLPPRRTLEAAVHPARHLLTSPPARLTTAQLLEHLRRLHTMLVAPAASQLQGIRELVVVADGILHTLPFEALVEPGGAPGDAAAAPFLLRRFRIRYAPSASLASPPAPIGAALVAYGGARAAPGFPALPASAEEVRAVAARYPAAARHVALGAGEAAFKADPALPNAGVIHLAVHGFIDDQWPLMSGLVLPETAGQSTGEDGFLRLYEILGLRLRAGLVVLSACDSGNGREVTGEGLSSLRRAFLAAGARAIVASLWRVDDRSAARMMTVFHRHLLIPGRTPADALQAAQLELIQTGQAHPYHWSVFTLMTSG